MEKPKSTKMKDFLGSVNQRFPKHLYTYVTNICNSNTSKYKGMSIIPSISAMRELMKYGKMLSDIAVMLEQGHDAPRRRKKGIVEKWIDKGKKTFNIVIAKDYNEQAKKEVWILIHFGKFTRRKSK